MKTLEKILKRRESLHKEIEHIADRISFFEGPVHGSSSKFFIGCGFETKLNTSVYLKADEFEKSVLPILKERLESFKTKLDHIDKRIEAAELIFSEFE